ncbi:MAG: hypothetical protein ROO71_01675 [Balneola sp.]
MKSTTKILNDRDKILFEKALKFYFFARQVDSKRLSHDVSERLYYTGSVAYSLVITYAKSGSLKIEYMDFLNQELKTMLSSGDKVYEPLQIKPAEIDGIELMKKTKISFFDEDENSDSELIYYTNRNLLELKKL